MKKKETKVGEKKEGMKPAPKELSGAGKKGSAKMTVMVTKKGKK